MVGYTLRQVKHIALLQVHLCCDLLRGGVQQHPHLLAGLLEHENVVVVDVRGLADLPRRCEVAVEAAGQPRAAEEAVLQVTEARSGALQLVDDEGPALPTRFEVLRAREVRSCQEVPDLCVVVDGVRAQAVLAGRLLPARWQAPHHGRSPEPELHAGTACVVQRGTLASRQAPHPRDVRLPPARWVVVAEQPQELLHPKGQLRGRARAVQPLPAEGGVSEEGAASRLALGGQERGECRGAHHGRRFSGGAGRCGAVELAACLGCSW
mmetsp:Transcript_28085/g.89279  ORF Transcript_28085/g.89279 Transcript_28085/m.89279 type:complete len:266 (-) Transcript_28085:589-1386(-)